MVLLATANSPAVEDAPRPPGRCHFSGFFPGRPADCYWELGSNGQGLGDGQRAGIAEPQRARCANLVCRFFAGWTEDYHWQLGSDSEDLGREEWNDSRYAQRPQRAD